MASPYIDQNLRVALGWHSRREPCWPLNGSETDRKPPPVSELTVSAVLRVSGGSTLCGVTPETPPTIQCVFQNKSRCGPSC